MFLLISLAFVAKKAFDFVHRLSIRKILKSYGLPEKELTGRHFEFP